LKHESSDLCTFLLSSYDNGEDCWNAFFTALLDNWKNFDMKVVLNTESKSYEFPGINITTFSLFKPGVNIPWGFRLIETLKRIKTKYILFFLEDFWLDSEVDVDFFEKTIRWMEENPDIATFSYYPAGNNNIKDNVFERFELRPAKCEFKLNAQAAVWRREKLISFIRPHENPWEFEVWGSKRAARYKDRFYTLIRGAEPVFSYGDPMEGCIIHRGKWNKDAVMKFERKYSLGIDYSIRGFEDYETVRRLDNQTFFEKLMNPSAVKRKLSRCTPYQWYRVWKSLKP